MKLSLIPFILIISIGHLQGQNTTDSLKQNRHKNFKLSYTSVGLGSNMTTQQPRFIIKGLHYVYTLEDAWKFKNVKKNKPRNLGTGFIRPSSIDSILNIAREAKQKFVYKSNPKVRSGNMVYLNVDSLKQIIHFELINAKDENAAKIVAILNEYIPGNIRPLFISDIDALVIQMK